MKTTKILMLAAVMSVGLFSAGCKKKSNNNASAFLTKSAWKYSAITQNGVDIIQDCEKDDIETYLANGTFTFNFGADDCSGNEDNISAPWKFINNNSSIVYGTPPDADTVNVVALDDNNFKYAFTDDPNYIIILKH